jgi:hypothetical protein
MLSLLSRISFCLLGGALAAQDMLAVGWGGRIFALDPVNGRAEDVSLGAFGQNALAGDRSGRLWSTARLGNTQFFLTSIDPVSGAVEFAHPSMDFRGLALARGDTLFGVEAVAGFDTQLWRVDTATGAHTRIGSTQTTAIQSLAFHGGVLWGWQWVNGLVSIDTTSGAATDPFPATAGNLLIQWLASHPSLGLIGGTADGVYSIDPTNGTTALLASLPSGLDLRGAEATSFALPYGTGCDLGQGPIALRASGPLRADGGLLTLVSEHNVAGSLRALVVGFSRDQYAGRALPILLDPIFGSQGCHLHASIEAVGFYLAAGNPTTSLTVPVMLPPTPMAVDLFVQAFDLHQPQLPLGSSNGLMLHIAR